MRAGTWIALPNMQKAVGRYDLMSSTCVTNNSNVVVMVTLHAATLLRSLWAISDGHKLRVTYSWHLTAMNGTTVQSSSLSEGCCDCESKLPHVDRQRVTAKVTFESTTWTSKTQAKQSIKAGSGSYYELFPRPIYSTIPLIIGSISTTTCRFELRQRSR
jgi:hypothetical protein